MTSVKLRQKPLSGGRMRLYLDYYPPISDQETGKKTRREFLEIFIYKNPKSSQERSHNKENLQLAEGIRSNRQNDITFNKYGFVSPSKRKKTFIDYMNELAASKSEKTRPTWESTIKHFEAFSQGVIKMGDLNEGLCIEFREYLLSAPKRNIEGGKIARNSACTYFTKFKKALKEGYKNGYLQVNLNSKIENIKTQDTKREVLSLKELSKLFNTQCKIPVLKKASLFSALTGIPYQVLEDLIWNQIIERPDGYYINYMRSKTNSYTTHPIPILAYELLGNREGINQKVFKDLKYSSTNNDHLKTWISKAGINRHITFHCFRHTYACLQLELGAEIYTVRDLLAHKSVRTTEIYGKLTNKKKREAADRLTISIN